MSDQIKPLSELPKEALVELYSRTLIREEEIVAEKVTIKDELMSRMKGDAEIVGEYSLTKVKKVMFKTSLEEARQLGAIKEAVDTNVLRQLYKKGADIPGTKVSEYLMIKNIVQEKKNNE